MTNTTFTTATIIFVLLFAFVFGATALKNVEMAKEIDALKSSLNACATQKESDQAKIAACTQETKTCNETRTKQAQACTADKATLEQDKKTCEATAAKLITENALLGSNSTASTQPNGSNAPGAITTPVKQIVITTAKTEGLPSLAIFFAFTALANITYYAARKWNDQRSHQITVRMDRSTFADYVRYMRSR